MILYHGKSFLNRLKAILHHMVYHKDEKCILVGAFDDSYLYFDNVEVAISYPSFDNGAWGNGCNLEGEELSQYILNYFDKVFENKNIRLEDINEFYIASYEQEFSKYLQLKKTYHNFMEEANSNITGSDNKFIKQIYCLLSEVDNKVDNMINYDLTEEIYKLDIEQRKKIINFFNVPTTKIDPKYDILLLTQWWWTDETQTKILNDNIIMYMYGLILDYYCKENSNIYIKTHPTDSRKTDYEKYFTNCIVEKDAKYVSELMGLIPEIHFEKSITISSSSIYTVKGFSNEILKIGKDYKELHHKIIKYDVATNLAKFLHEFNLGVIRYGINDSDLNILPNLFDGIKSGDCSICNQIVIFDEINIDRVKFLESLEDTNNCFIFTNLFEEIFNEYSFEINNVLFIEISKEKTKKISASDLETEYLYIYCKNTKIRNKIQDFIFIKKLHQTGIEIKAKTFNLSKIQLHFENIKLQSKQVELNNKVKTLEQGMVQTQKQNETLKNELIKVIQKSNAFEKFAVDSKNMIEMYKQEFVKINKRLNELEK